MGAYMLRKDGVLLAGEQWEGRGVGDDVWEVRVKGNGGGGQVSWGLTAHF